MTTREELAEIEWWSSSHHEAGHAAVLVYYRMPITEVRLGVHAPWLGRPSAEGVVRNDMEIEDCGDETLAAWVVVATAGAEAQARWVADHYNMGIRAARDYTFRTGASSDMELAGKCLDMIGANRRFARRLERAAQDAVANVWDSIVDIAEALRDNNGYLTGGQIYDIA